MHGFGAVVKAEGSAAVFQIPWHARVFALTLAVPFVVQCAVDEFRYAIEGIPPEEYLHSSYYERFLKALVQILKQRGVLLEDARDNSLRIPPGWLPPLPAASQLAVRTAIALGSSQSRPDTPEAAHRFTTGQRVRAKAHRGRGHTRLPRYARGRLGIVEAELGVFVFPDSHVANGNEAPQALYRVRFSAHELWGADARAGDSVSVDLWDEYLDCATT
jgi:nitrile hydratase beta subunit